MHSTLHEALICVQAPTCCALPSSNKKARTSTHRLACKTPSATSECSSTSGISLMSPRGMCQVPTPSNQRHAELYRSVSVLLCNIHTPARSPARRRDWRDDSALPPSLHHLSIMFLAHQQSQVLSCAVAIPRLIPYSIRVKPPPTRASEFRSCTCVFAYKNDKHTYVQQYLYNACRYLFAPANGLHGWRKGEATPGSSTSMFLKPTKPHVPSETSVGRAMGQHTYVFGRCHSG